MENIKCRCDKGYNACKGEIKQRDLKKDFQWDVSLKNYKLNLCDYHFSVVNFMRFKIIKMLKEK